MAVDVMMAEPLPDLSFRQIVDPDAQATVSDFVDYTEIFPSDLIRSLTLIRNLDQTYNDATTRVHELTRTYSILPSLPAQERPDPEALRADISRALDRADACRQAALAEASRLVETSDRNSSRLATITRKLKELPKPPSRDPTPIISPQLARSRKQENEKKNRFGVHIEGVGSGMLKSQKQRKVLIPGDVLPPGEELLYNAIASGDDAESSREASPVIDGLHEVDQISEGPRKIRIPKTPKLPKIKIARTPRALLDPDRPRGPGRNISSSGVSTSVALSLLTPPPADAKPGSRWQPWFELTKYELATLRKLMKKHAEWRPSETMCRRELARTGRGPDNYQRAKAAAEAKGEKVLDEIPIDHQVAEEAKLEVVPEKSVEKPASVIEEPAEKPVPSTETKRQKKKREDKIEKEQEEARNATSLAEANKLIAASSELIQNLFGRRNSMQSPLTVPPKSSKKRKRDISKELTPVSVKGAAPAEPDSSVRSGGPKRLQLLSPKPVPPPLPSATFSASSALSPIRNDIIMDTEKISPIPEDDLLTPKPVNIPTKEPHSSPQATAGAVEQEMVPAEEEEVKPIPPPVFQPIAPSTRPKRSTSLSKKSSPKIVAAELPTPSERVLRNATKTPEPSIVHPKSRNSLPRNSLPPTTSQKAASMEPLASDRVTRSRHDRRRASDAEGSQVPETPKEAPPEATVRVARPRRKPAPGIITEDEGGKERVSITTRPARNVVRKPIAVSGATTPAANASAKKDKTVKEALESAIIDEVHDRQGETLYCLCNDVSYGTMIACENDNCVKEWFHLPCVNRTEIPPRRQKWFCPDCRVLLKCDESGKPLPSLAAAKADAKASRTPVNGPNYALSVSERVKRGRRQSDDNNNNGGTLVGA